MEVELILVVSLLGTFFAVTWSPLVGLLVSLPPVLFSAGHRWLYIFVKTIGRDLLVIYRFINTLITTLSAKYRDIAVAKKFLQIASRYPNKTCITFCSEQGDTKLSFREAAEKSCQVARCFQQKGYKKGDVVALVLENRLDYCCYWLGLSMIGVVPALVNTNLRKNGLLHSIKVAGARSIIFSSDLQPVVLELAPELDEGTELYTVDEAGAASLQNVQQLQPLLDQQPAHHFNITNVGYNDDLFYIYTSGTTGLPKAAIIKNSRFMFTVYALFCMAKINVDDVLYSPLPMYHTAAGAMVTGNAIMEGVSIVSRKKFSASNYWADCCRNDVTCAQYIGEVARYLLATPPSKYDKQHKIRMMFGNGLRLEVWQQFVDRFQIPLVCEFYGATEGNCSVGNIMGRVGSVGFISVLFPFLLPLGLIAVDEETREPLRDKNGLCIPCAVGQPGELVGRIDKGHPVRDFHGYADKKATNKKIIHDVWKKGDSCFRSGDILEMDELGWLFFKDRAGDTFRWKGENVSTSEVESVCMSVLGKKDCVVYGVEVPGCEGRAGMLALPDQSRTVDLKFFYEELDSRLPSYSKPLFIRIVDKIELTATFKLKKRELQRQGFDPELVHDPVYIIDHQSRNYVEMTSSTFSALNAGKLKL